MARGTAERFWGKLHCDQNSWLSTTLSWEEWLFRNWGTIFKGIFLSRTASDNHEIWSQCTSPYDLSKSSKKKFCRTPTPSLQRNPLYWHVCVNIGDSPLELAWGIGEKSFGVISIDLGLGYIVTKFHGYRTSSGWEKRLFWRPETIFKGIFLSRTASDNHKI